MAVTWITHYTVTPFSFPRDRIIGDSQVSIDTLHMAALELHTNTGITGTGFWGNLFHEMPPQDEITRIIDNEIAPGFLNQHPSALVNRVSVPRGGNRRGTSLALGEAINQAAWDIIAREQELPLYKVFGGTNNSVPAYASGLGFHLNDDDIVTFYERAKSLGYTSYKIKIGHPDLNWDLRRLRLIQEVVGKSARLMVDANEAWSPKEAIRRLQAYHDAGFDIYWVEDPCMRDDFNGLRQIMAAVPFVHVNSGEYLDLSGKRSLLESRAVDILNIHGNFTDSLKAAWLAAEHGIPVSLGNTAFELGIHLAVSLPEVKGFEYSFLNYNHLMETPVRIEDGIAYAPDIPGHGLRLSDDARHEFARKA